MERRNRERIRYMVRLELEQEIRKAEEYLDKLKTVHNWQESNAMRGHVDWYENIIKVLSWLVTRYRVTSPTVLKEIADAKNNPPSEPTSSHTTLESDTDTA